jgi:hypothetical protein
LTSEEGTAGETPDLVARSREATEAWNAEGLERFAEQFWGPDLVWEEDPNFPEAGVRRGRQACVERMLERFEAVGHVEITPGEVRQLGESHVLLELVIRGRGSASGAPTEMREWFVSEMDRDGFTVHMREVLYRDAALAAARELADSGDSG